MRSVNQTADSGTSWIGEITRAIDQLAADSRAGAPGVIMPELAERIATIWAMLAARDPALARLITRYETRDR